MRKLEIQRLVIMAMFAGSLLAAQSEDCAAQDVAPGAATTTAELAAPYRTVTYSYPAPKGATDPFFSHGYLIQFKHHTDIHRIPNIYLYSSSGQLEHKVTIWPEGAVTLFLSSVDVGANGRLAFAGQVRKSDGTELNIIATSDLDGNAPTYFSTGNYLATLIAQADDSSVWAVGVEHAQLSGTSKSWKNYDMLRHFNSSGRLIDHYLPRWHAEIAYVANTTTTDSEGTTKADSAAYNSSGVPITSAYIPPVWGYRDAWKTSRRVFLRSTGSSTLLYDAKHGKLYRYSASSRGFSSQNVYMDNTKGYRITGLAVSSDGLLLASLESIGQNGTGTSDFFKLKTLPSGQSAFWSRLGTSQVAPSAFGNAPTLLGFDGNAIVSTTRGANGTEVAWSMITSEP